MRPCPANLLDEAGNPLYSEAMKPMGFLSGVPGFLLCAGLAACAVGPDYHQPAAPAVSGYTTTALPAATAVAGGVSQQFVSGQDISADWWTLFGSPELNDLINAALQNNPTLVAAQNTLLEAEENVRAEQGAFFPGISGSLQYERQKPSSAELATAGGSLTNNASVNIPPFNLYNASVSVSYSPDVFGLVRRQVEGLAAQADYQRYELEAAYLTLTSNIVTAAVAEASLNAQIAATRQIIAIDQHQLNILNQQFSFGGVAMADVLSEQAALASAEANLPPLEALLAQERNQLADYVGVFPANFHYDDFTLESLNLPSTVPESLPSALVNQRPDIQAAAAQLHEASANVGVATANMLPQITLSANVGQEALEAGSLFTPDNLLWSLVAGVTQPIFEGGTLSAKRKASIAALQASGAQYQVTVLAAFQNVANALQALQYDADTLAADQVAEQASARSLKVIQSQVQLGGQPFTAVLTAQSTYQTAIIARVKAQASRLSDSAALYQALGGGWWHRDDPGKAANACCGLNP
jgi:NodT family efflux transporter outer membrane factor (OMF) lipoprotein